ncbi:hypothetical protein QQP08_018611 [Theobroma cacao]|nr:hypothetical protein QQP08_018611 [Theobroma cacao]
MASYYLEKERLLLFLPTVQSTEEAWKFLHILRRIPTGSIVTIISLGIWGAGRDKRGTIALIELEDKHSRKGLVAMVQKRNKLQELEWSAREELEEKTFRTRTPSMPVGNDCKLNFVDLFHFTVMSIIALNAEYCSLVALNWND